MTAARELRLRRGVGALAALALGLAAATLAAPARAQSCAACQQTVLGFPQCCGGEGEPTCTFPVNTCGGALCQAPAVPNGVGNYCELPRKLGEACSDAFFPCESNLTCEFQPWEPAFRCVMADPNAEDPGTAFANQLCDDLYSEAVHDAVRSGGAGAWALGAGAGATVGGLAGTIELGTAYGRKGEYGCYRTACAGVEISDTAGSASVYGSASTYPSYASIAGADATTSLSIGFTAFNFAVNVSIGTIFTGSTPPNDPGVEVGGSVALGVGGEAGIPAPIKPSVSGSVLACTTELNQRLFPPSPIAYSSDKHYVEIGATGGNGHPDQPWSSISDGIAGIESDGAAAIEGDLFIDGDADVAAGTQLGVGLTKQITLHATKRTCQNAPSESCSVDSDCSLFASRYCEYQPGTSCTTNADCTGGTSCIPGDVCVGMTISGI